MLLQLLLPPPLSTHSVGHLHRTNGFNFSSRRFLLLPKPPHSSASPSSLPSLQNAVNVDTFSKYSGYLFKLTSSEADSLTDYNISRIAAFYQKKPLILFRRLFQIATTLGKWFAFRYIDAATDRADQMFEVRAEELRKVLVELGPAYIKIAQAISSRPDLIPPSYLDELSLLQDRIAPFSTEVAFGMIEKELGQPIDAVFSEISPEPVAAASLGQVYQARLRSNGQVVAVKVQRPGVQAAISLDILILRYLAGLIKRAGKFNTDLQAGEVQFPAKSGINLIHCCLHHCIRNGSRKELDMPLAVVDEWASSLFREMDYENEARNGVKFRELYGGIKDVVVPKMFLNQTTRKVLVMQWVEGQKLAEVKDLYLVEVGVYCSFNQLLECGFYHADPHPGNLLRTYDGKLAYLDFGMVGEFKQELRDGFIEACLHLVNRDYDALAKDFVTLGLLPPAADKDAVTQALTGVFRDALARGIRNISFGDLLGNLGVTMYKFKFQIPSYFSLVIRSLAVLEGIAVSLDPNYKVLGSTYPWIARKVLTDSSSKLQSSLQALLYKDGVFRIDRLESLVTESLRARTERSIKKQIEDGDSKIIVKEVLSFTLNEKGSFVREILLDEFAKGLDALGIATLESVASSVTANIPFATSQSFSLLNDEDISNLRTFRRLMLLLSGLRESGRMGAGVKEAGAYNKQRISSNEYSLARYQSVSMQEIEPLLAAIPELPQELQQQLLQLPTSLAAKLASRIAARALKRIFL